MAVKNKFDFKLKQQVALKSGEKGEIVGRAHYVDSNPQYHIRYIAADGRMTTSWWDESALEAA